MHINQAVIVAGGLGTRLGDKSQNCPKPLQLIDGIPFLDYLIWNLKRYGINNIILSIGFLGHKISSRYKNGGNFGVNIEYITENSPAGTGGALLLCKDKLNDFFFFLNGDTIFDINFHALGMELLSNEALGVLGLNYITNAKRYGSVEVEKNMVVSFKEKGGSENCYINGGILALRKSVINYIKQIPSSLENDLFPVLVEKKLLRAKKFKNFFIDIGVPSSLMEAQILMPKWKKKSAVFIDRDGVLNVDYGYVHDKKNFKFIDGAINAIKRLNELGFLVIVVTNQAGIGRGFYTEKQFNQFMEWINGVLKEKGAHIDDWYYCPHHPTEGKGEYRKLCDCRKPKSGLLELAINNWQLDKKRIIMVGDKDSDIEAGNNLNINSYKYDSNSESLETFFNKLPLEMLLG